MNNIKKEEKALSTFIESLKTYSSGLKNLEENTCRRLNEVQSVEKMVVMSGWDKGIQIGLKTVTNDIVGGGITAVTGAGLASTSIVAEPETSGTSTIGVIVGVSMAASGGNTFLNGIRDFKYELNYEWSEVGQHNFLTDSTADVITAITGSDKGGKITGNAVTTFVDITSAGKSIWDLKKVPSDVRNIMKITNVDDSLESIKSMDSIVRSDIVGGWYNYQTIKGDVQSLQGSVYGDNFKSNNAMDGVNINSNSVISAYPNIVTIYNDGKPQLWLKDINKTTK